jgi:hypothetical protein
MTDVTAIKRRSAGAWVTCSNVYRRSAGSWVVVWSSGGAIMLSSNDGGSNYVLGPSSTSWPSPATTTATTITATGGSGGTKTYAWTFVSGDASVLCNSASSATTHFHNSAGIPIGGLKSAIWKCTVSDGTFTSVINETVTFDNS